MNNKTKENLNGIQTIDEYNEAVERLEYYRKEYIWATDESSNKSKSQEVYEEARKIIPMINGENSREQREYIKEYYSLMRKKSLIDNGEYAVKLKNNMMALLVKIKEYKLKTKEYGFFSFYKAFLSGDKNLKEDLKINRILARAKYDGIAREESLNLQPVDEIVAYINKNCGLVDIKGPEKLEDSKLPAISEGYLTRSQQVMIDIVNSYIANGDITNSNITNVEISNEKLNGEEEINVVREKNMTGNINNIGNRTVIDNNKVDRNERGNEGKEAKGDKAKERGNTGKEEGDKAKERGNTGKEEGDKAKGNKENGEIGIN